MFNRFSYISVLLVLITVSCGSPPSAPDMTIGSNSIRLLNSDAAFEGSEDTILKVAGDALSAAAQQIDIRDVNIDISLTSDGTIYGYGIGGFTPDRNTVRISIDPAYAEHPALYETRLPLVVMHELHHAVRWKNPGYGSTLFEAMVTEGLADRFAVELLDTVPPPWSVALPEDVKPNLRMEADRELSNSSYSHAKWFFGEGSTYPFWTGYTLGYDLVTAYLDTQPDGVTAGTLVDAPHSLFLDTWEEQL